ncbi:MAG: hypothetical protein AAFZ18_30940 [Myxococcota bacterium]
MWIPQLWAALASTTPLQCPHALLERGADGEILRGSPAQVIEVLRAGGRLRVGWFHPRRDDRAPVVHWVDGGFVTELGPHVFAQFGAIHSQQPVRSPLAIRLREARNAWYGLVGTDGVLQGRTHDGDVKSRPVPMIWCESPETYHRRCAKDWRVLYRHDAKGHPVGGDKSALIDAVRRGRPLRMAWGGKKGSVTWAHNAEPVFVTLTKFEVIAQLPEHLAQTSYHDAAKARFVDASWVWRGLLSTTGTFDAAWVDRGTGQQVLRLPQRAAVTWFAYTSDEACLADPLELSVEGGVVLDPTHPRVDLRDRD